MSRQPPTTPPLRSTLPRLGPATSRSPSGLPLLSTPSSPPTSHSPLHIAPNSGNLRTVDVTRSPSRSETSIDGVAAVSSVVTGSPSRTVTKRKSPKRRLRRTLPRRGTRTRTPEIDDDVAVDGDGDYVPPDDAGDDDEEDDHSFHPLLSLGVGVSDSGTVPVLVPVGPESRSGSGRRGLRRSRSSSVGDGVGDGIDEAPSTSTGPGTVPDTVPVGEETETGTETGPAAAADSENENELEGEGELVWESYSSWESISSEEEEDEERNENREKKSSVGSGSPSVPVPGYDLLPKKTRRSRSRSSGGRPREPVVVGPVAIPLPPPVPPPGASVSSSIPPVPVPVPPPSLPLLLPELPPPPPPPPHSDSASTSTTHPRPRPRRRRRRRRRGRDADRVEARCVVGGKVLVKCSDGRFRKKQQYPRSKALARVRRVEVDVEFLKARFKASARCRGTLPLHAVETLRGWFLEHCQRPYPDSAQRKKLAQKTGLTHTQVTDWFTNKRRRIWKPYMSELEKKAIASGTLKNRRKVRRRKQVRVMKSPPSSSRRRTRSGSAGSGAKAGGEAEAEAEPGSRSGGAAAAAAAGSGRPRRQSRTSSSSSRRTRKGKDHEQDHEGPTPPTNRIQFLSRENDTLKKEHVSLISEQGDLLQNVLAKVRRAVNVHGSNPEMEDIIQTLLPPVKRSREQLQMDLAAVSESPEELEEERRSALSHQPPRKRRKFREMQDGTGPGSGSATVPASADLTHPPNPKDDGGMPPEIAAMMGMGFVISPHPPPPIPPPHVGVSGPVDDQ